MITFRTLGKLGRFGNQLFQYAGTRLYAELNGFDWAFPPWIGDRLFDIPRKSIGYRHLLPTIQLADMWSTSWSERLLHPLGLWKRDAMNALYAHPKDNINLYGYLQDEISLEKLRQQRSRVCSWFTWQPHIEHAFRTATKKYAPWVGMHIRHGDFVKRGLAIPAARYVDIAKSFPPSTPLYIASDDPSAVDAFTDLPIIRPNNPLSDLPDFVFDFWMLQHASAIYGSDSTFSWWAAYLNPIASYHPQSL